MKKRIWTIGFLVFAGVLMLCLFSYFHVSNSTAAYLTMDAEDLPSKKVAVVLGTSAYLSKGGNNPYFQHRIKAAAELYHNNVVEYILVSGDNRRSDYNEPREMQRALINKGVPEERIILDYAGFRTLDSMIRAREVFGLQEFIVVSQAFHNSRAVYIARHKDMDVYGYNAADVDIRFGIWTRVREVLARVKMMLDLYVLHTEPKFLGEKVLIGG